MREAGKPDGLKHLRSSSSDLRQLFEQSINVREIAEPLASFDADANLAVIRSFMEERDFDLVGVREGGVVTGYALRSDLQGELLATNRLLITSAAILPDRASLLEVFELLRDRGFVIITVSGAAWGIVTRGDLQKAPVRMWLFGLVTLTEMQMLRLVGLCYPNDGWREKDLVSSKRLQQAEELFEIRRQKNEEIGLTECLQLCDKASILGKTGTLLTDLCGTSKAKAEALFRQVEKLRNHLAHAQDIVTEHWPQMVDIVVALEAFLGRCEALNSDELEARVGRPG